MSPPPCFRCSKPLLLLLFSLVICLSSLPLSPAAPSPSPSPAPFPSLHRHHHVPHFTYLGRRAPRWHKRTLEYAFSPDHGISYLDPAEVRAVFARAFARWSAYIPVTFTETEDYEQADVKIGWYSGDHGDGAPFDGVSSVLAHSFAPEDGRLHLDADERWTTDLRKEPPWEYAVDLETVATHEIGHLLGLGHSSDNDAVMFPFLVQGTRKVELGGDDVVGIQTLYGVIPFD